MQTHLITSLRHRAYLVQNGCCYYCGLPMRPSGADPIDDLPGLPDCLKATAEHLVARCDGGPTTTANIVAAHAICNHRRHRRARPLDPQCYRERVQLRIARGAWFDESIHRKLAKLGASRLGESP